jgi:hypothetical protein
MIAATVAFGFHRFVMTQLSVTKFNRAKTSPRQGKMCHCIESEQTDVSSHGFVFKFITLKGDSPCKRAQPLKVYPALLL